MPGILDRGVIDEVVTVSNDESLRHGAPRGAGGGPARRHLLRRAALAAAFRLAREDGYAGKLIVAIIPSFAERYLSTALFEGL